MSTIEQRVQAGAAWLDENQPGWESKIDLDFLDQSYCYECVLGQVFGDYWDSPLVQNATSSTRLCALGFASKAFSTSLGYKKLTQAWKDLISSRRAAEVKL